MVVRRLPLRRCSPVDARRSLAGSARRSRPSALRRCILARGNPWRPRLGSGGSELDHSCRSSVGRPCDGGARCRVGRCADDRGVGLLGRCVTDAVVRTVADAMVLCRPVRLRAVARSVAGASRAAKPHSAGGVLGHVSHRTAAVAGLGGAALAVGLAASAGSRHGRSSALRCSWSAARSACGRASRWRYAARAHRCPQSPHDGWSWPARIVLCGTRWRWQALPRRWVSVCGWAHGW